MDKFASEISDVGEAACPKRCADDVESEEFLVAHLADASHDRCKCAYKWDEHCQDDGFRAMLFIEGFGLFEVFLTKEPAVLALKQTASDSMAEHVAGAISEHGSDEEDKHERVNVDREEMLLNKESGGKQQAIARKKKSDHEAGFGINHRSDCEPAKVGDEVQEGFH